MAGASVAFCSSSFDMSLVALVVRLCYYSIVPNVRSSRSPSRRGRCASTTAKRPRPGSGSRGPSGAATSADSARLSRRIGPGLTPLDTSAAFPAFENSKEHHGEWSQSTDQLVLNLSSRRKGAVEADSKVTVCKGTPRETCAAEPRV